MHVEIKRRTIFLCNDMSSSLTLDANFKKSGGGCGWGGAEPTKDMSTVIFAKSRDPPPPFDAYLIIVF